MMKATIYLLAGMLLLTLSCRGNSSAKSTGNTDNS